MIHDEKLMALLARVDAMYGRVQNSAQHATEEVNLELTIALSDLEGAARSAGYHLNDIRFK